MVASGQVVAEYSLVRSKNPWSRMDAPKHCWMEEKVQMIYDYNILH